MKRLLLFLVIAAAVLGGLWYGLRPSSSPPAASPVTADTKPAANVADATNAAAPAASSVQRFELRPPAAGMPATVLQVQEGDNVALVVTSAHNDELHLHGYDLSLQLQPGVPGTLLFQAQHAGRFDVELHHAHAELAVLEVRPR
jgi:FtsP/CotA-like multicopper oxidase with cupredoxin domain